MLKRVPFLCTGNQGEIMDGDRQVHDLIRNQLSDFFCLQLRLCQGDL